MLDGIFCRALANELNGLTGAKIEKIHHISSKEIVFELFCGERKTLLISALPSAPRICFVEEYDRPQNPTMLCMLLRKHLTGGRILKVSAVEDERIICFDLVASDDLGHISEKRIYVELMGKYSNVILCGADDKILGAFSVSDITDKRCIMVGAKYMPPEKQSKYPPFSVTKEQFFFLINDNLSRTSDDFLLHHFLGFSPVTAREVCFKATGETDTLLLKTDKDKLWSEFSSLLNSVSEGTVTPFIAEGGKAFSYTVLNQYGHGGKALPALTDLLKEFYSEKAIAAEVKQLSYDISRVLTNAQNRLEKKLSLQKEELADCGKKDVYRTRGGLITANIYRIKHGDSSVICTDYETGEDVTIFLDPRLSPAGNAQKLYARYAKLKRAEEHLTVLIAEGEAELNYIHTVFDALSRARTRKELDEIRIELGEVGYMSRQVGKKSNKKTPAGQPLEFTTTDGMKVLVGRNNRQNDALTGGADKNDLWFHVKNFAGSHVILLTEGVEPTDRDYTQAAMLAAYHSSIRGASNAEVDYARVRYVKKPSGSKPGYVTYDKYYTAIVDAVMPKL